MTDLGKITRAMNYLETHEIEIGILGIGGQVPGLFGGKRREFTVLEYGWALEYGTSKMKPFGFFRQALEKNEAEIQDYAEELVNEILDGKLDGRPACMRMGEYIRGLVVQTIANANEWARPLTPKYQKWKSKKYPNRTNQKLILDGFLIKSIRYKIKRGNTMEFVSTWAKL